MGYLIGSIFGSVMFVALFLAIAGVRLQNGRQVFAAYLALGIAAFFASAVGAADGGPPNFEMAPLQLVGAAVAAVGHWLLLKFGRRPSPEVRPV